MSEIEDSRSLAEQIASLPTEEYDEIMGALSKEEVEALEYDADFWLRPAQKIDDGGDWHITAVTSGRGWGKSLAASQWIRKKAIENPGTRIAVAGRTVGDVRRVMVSGESGILAVSPESEMPVFKQNISSLIWPNGSVAELHSSEAPDSCRGPQYAYAAGDEFAAWKTDTDSSGATLYTNLQMATRLGRNPQILLTTTPKRTQVMKDIFERSRDPKEKIRIITGKTTDNTSLSRTYLDSMLRQFSNSDLMKQELYGEMLEDSDGIVFSQEMLDKAHTALQLPRYPLRIIAVDPSVSADQKTSDECGIVAMGSTVERDLTKRRAVLLDDYSLRASPDVWAEVIVEAAQKHKTKFVVVEKNQGGDLLRSVIQAKDPSLKVFTVWASKGKQKRTEPVVILMQQARIAFNDYFPALEDQMLFYDPEDRSTSPDRMDAFVWGATSLLVSPPEGLRIPSASSYNPAGLKMGSGLSQVSSSRFGNSVKKKR